MSASDRQGMPRNDIHLCQLGHVSLIEVDLGLSFELTDTRKHILFAHFLWHGATAV